MFDRLLLVPKTQEMNERTDRKANVLYINVIYCVLFTRVLLARVLFINRVCFIILHTQHVIVA